MPAGKRQERIRFERHGTTGDGYGGRLPGWTQIGAVSFAAFKVMAGKEQLDAQKLEARTFYEVTIVNRRDLTAADRIVWLSNGNQILNIRSLGDAGVRDRERTLTCELKGPESD